MKNLLWYLIAGTKGGETRGKIIDLLRKTPSNANKIAEILKLDYKTIRHHLEVLEKNNIISPINKGNYGAVYFLSEFMQANIKLFDEIWGQFGKK
ncbi:winged helix-turn-helix transcriptional regulator [Candidatus Woesearchaeota archaeon]|nr:winged helix-turn-helix transcriptional regulator [Candidatus Woesearchaeota archaeon]